MKKELIKKLYLKEVVTILLFFVSVSIYLKIPTSRVDVLTYDIEVIEKGESDISTYLDEDIDFSYGFKTAFYNTLPLTQIIEYKKQKFIYNMALYYNEGKQIPKDIKNILVSTNTLYSMKVLKLENSNSQYTLYQFLGVISALLIITTIYFIIKFKRPNFLNYYIFLIILFYITNLIFLGLKSDKEMLTERTLQELSSKNKLN